MTAGRIRQLFTGSSSPSSPPTPSRSWWRPARAGIRPTATSAGLPAFSRPCAASSLPHGFSLHYYTDLRPTPVKAGDFKAAEWYEVLLRGVRLEKVIEDHWAEMGKFDAAHRTKLVIDEWGVWYAPGSEITPAYILSETITLRDAVHTGMTFDIFNRHADKIAMANVAQSINCIHSLFLAQGDKFVRTPVYHVFDMYRAHMGARQVPVSNPVPELTVPVLAGQARLPGLSASASIRDRRLDGDVDQPFARTRLVSADTVGRRGARHGSARPRY